MAEAPRAEVRTRPPLRAFVAAALALLGAVGVAVLDDYPLRYNAADVRNLGHATLDFSLGDEAGFRERLGQYSDQLRFYGAVLEAPLALAERALGQTDSRDIHLTRHLLTHLFFLVGAAAAALLARRLFGGVWPALFASAAFALHPRLYAHSFFNSRDAPFAALFMVCLCLTHWAFRRGTLGAFALLGVGVGALVNLRVMGALLFAAVLAMRTLDVAVASSPAARRRAMATGAAFTGAALLTLYAISPYLWADPSRLVDAFVLLAQHPHNTQSLFQGSWVRWPDLPAHYVPVWIAITSPAGLLALCLVGAAAVLSRGLIPLAGVVRNAPPRFGLLLAACPMLAIIAIVVVNANLYSGWFLVFFLWAPISLLAVAGVRWLGAVGGGHRRTLRRGAHGLAVACIGMNAAHLASTHPLQELHFNLLVDRDAPERLAPWYTISRMRTSYREGLRRALRHQPSATIGEERARKFLPLQAEMLPRKHRSRVALSWLVDTVVPDRLNCVGLRPTPEALAPAHVTVEVYDNTCFAARALDVAFMDIAPAETLRTAYAAVAARDPLVRSGYGLHLAPGEMTWLKEPCGESDSHGEFVFTAFSGVPETASVGAAESVCNFTRCGVRVGGACMAQTRLPAGPLATIVAGQRLRNGPWLWRTAVELTPAGAVGRDVTPVAVPAGSPLPADAPFDLHLDGDTLVYSRASCRPEDTQPRFYLHVFPQDPSALTEGRGDRFHNLDFQMEIHGEALLRRFGGRCVAWQRLPAGPIAYLRTGQFQEDGQSRWGRQLWSAEFVDLR